MNKRNVENNMDAACTAIRDVCKGDVDSSLRGKMSAFGAAVMMSGVKPAVAYFQKNEKKVIEMLCKMYKDAPNAEALGKKNKTELMEKAVSLKLAMNLFIH